MNKFKNKLYDKIISLRQFVKDNKKQSVFLFALVFSLGFYFIVFAGNNDPYAGKIISKVDITKSKVTDGSAPFDSNDSDGNDSKDNNKIVRNFDEVSYDLSYKLEKDSSISDENVSDRNVLIDILIPENVSAEISLPYTEGKDMVNINGINYKYYEASAGSAKIGDQSSSRVTLSNITHLSGNKTFDPIFQVRESTENVTPLSKAESIQSNDHIMNFGNITISEIEKYEVKAFAGNVLKNGNNISVPIGVLTYLPYDSKKGIKGLKIPDTLTYGLITKSSAGTLSEKPTISDYSSSAEFRINQMPYIDSKINGTTIINDDNGNVESTGFFFDKKNIYKENSSSENPTGYYLTSNVLVYNLDRTDVSGDITVESTVNTSKVSIVVYESDVVGDLVTKVSYYESGDKSSKNLSNVFNYGEEFKLVTKLSYVNSKNNVGDTLKSGMTSYIKFDNSAINVLLTDKGTGYDIKAVTNSTDNYDDVNMEVKYAVGSWDKSAWKLKSNAPSTCPSIDSLTKEQIMNLYGGPCIEYKTTLEFDELGDIDKDKWDKIIMGKFTIDKVYPASDITITMKGKIVSAPSIVGNTYQTVVSSVTNGSDEYYLGETANNSSENEKIMINKDNYKKATYTNFVRNDDSPKGKHGNTLLVSATKSKINSIRTYSGDIEKTTFTAGADDPIIWKINSTVKKNSISVTYGPVNISVYIPTSLVFYQEKTAAVPSKVEDVVLNNISYKKYIYNISEKDIDSDGIVSELSVYTNIAPETENKTNHEIKVEIESTAYMDDSGAAIAKTSVEPISDRTLTNIVTIINNRKISLNGIADPQLLEVGKPYTYTMKAYNNSGNIMDLEMINILPVNTKEASFDGTYSVKINNLPSGYEALYINDENTKSGSILSTELSNPSLNKWVKWTDTMVDTENVKAIKIETTNKVANKNYFGSKEGISLTITPKNNKIGNEYINNFGIIDKNDRASGAYMTGNSIVSIYNRRISGYVFEDFDYDGLYGEKENKLEDLTVELYKLSNLPADYKDSEVTKYISDKDELVDETTTDKEGNYSFKGLESGYYYVKIKFDSNKYTVTDYEKIDQTKGDTNSINSKFYMLEENKGAISKVLYVDNNKLRERYINLGLKLRQSFGINLEKYITNVKIISPKGTENHDYNKAKQVKIDVKNLKNTKIEVTYKFELENTKYFPGYIGTIVETIPEGMSFDSSLKENYGWSGENGILYYSGLTNTLIMPDEKYYFQIKLSLSGEEAGDYINVISAGDLKLMETTESGIEENNEE